MDLYLKNIISRKSLTIKQKPEFLPYKIVQICENPFKDDNIQVCDHNCPHFTGQYRNAANSNCNINYKSIHKISVIFHNVTIYDSHFIVKELAIGLTWSLR